MGERSSTRASFWTTVHNEYRRTWTRGTWIFMGGVGVVIGSTVVPIWIQTEGTWTPRKQALMAGLALLGWIGTGLGLRYIWCAWRAPFIQRDAAIAELRHTENIPTGNEEIRATLKAEFDAQATALRHEYERDPSVILTRNLFAEKYDIGDNATVSAGEWLLGFWEWNGGNATYETAVQMLAAMWGIEDDAREDSETLMRNLAHEGLLKITKDRVTVTDAATALRKFLVDHQRKHGQES